MGIEKKFKLSSRWSAGLGLDAVFNDNEDNTSSALNPTIGGGNTQLRTTTVTYGGGPVAWLRFNISDRILIGTETSFYYVTGTQSSTVDEIGPLFVSGGPSFNPTVSQDVSKASFNTPVALFLHVKF
jgi:hypothetical protein